MSPLFNTISTWSTPLYYGGPDPPPQRLEGPSLLDDGTGAREAPSIRSLRGLRACHRRDGTHPPCLGRLRQYLGCATSTRGAASLKILLPLALPDITRTCRDSPASSAGVHVRHVSILFRLWWPTRPESINKALIRAFRGRTTLLPRLNYRRLPATPRPWWPYPGRWTSCGPGPP